MTKIAVVTPVYNGAEFLSDCVESVAKSVTFGQFEYEHLLVDDGSTDKSWEIIQRLKTRGLKTYRLDRNYGQSAARNYALQHTDADYVFCLDVDNVIFQNSLLRLENTARKFKQKWVYGDFLHTGKKLDYIIGSDYYGWSFSKPEDVIKSIFKGEHFFQQNSLYAVEIIRQVGLYDETLRDAEDLDLSIKLLLRRHFPFYLPGALYLHRFRGDNLSVKHLENKQLYRKNLDRLHKKYQKWLKF